MKNKQNVFGFVIFDHENQYLNLSLKNTKAKTGSQISDEMMAILESAPSSTVLKEKLSYVMSDSAKNQTNVNKSLKYIPIFSTYSIFSSSQILLGQSKICRKTASLSGES